MSASHQDVSITSAKDAKAGGEGRVGWRKRRRDDGGGDGVEVELDRRSFTIKVGISRTAGEGRMLIRYSNLLRIPSGGH